MRLIFAGTPEFAAVALRALLAAGHEVALVLTQPDRPAGRGMALQASPVKVVAQTAGIAVFQPASLRDAQAQAQLAAVGADAMVVAAYGLILPQAVLDLPHHGCINIHASLLPRWRGAAPIQRAILAGDAESGVGIMQMEAGLDTGPVLHEARVPISAVDTAASLHDKLADLGARLIVEALDGRALTPRVQPDVGVTYAAKIAKGEAPLDWRYSAVELERQVRAFNPFPGATAGCGGQAVKIWEASAEAGCAAPGVVVAAGREGIVVGCGTGLLRLVEIQKAGGKRLSAGNFLAGSPLKAGASFDLPA